MRWDFLAEARAIGPELAALRREFHRRPELGNREFETAARVERTLRALGIETRRLLDTAVVGRLAGGLPGPTVALRADKFLRGVTQICVRALKVGKRLARLLNGFLVFLSFALKLLFKLVCLGAQLLNKVSTRKHARALCL